MGTFRQMLDSAVDCKTTADVDEFMRREIAAVLEHRPELLHEEARSIVMENVGYMSGYLDRIEAGRVLELFGARHPVFGAIEEWPRTPEETLEIGRKMGERMKAGVR